MMPSVHVLTESFCPAWGVSWPRPGQRRSPRSNPALCRGHPGQGGALRVHASCTAAGRDAAHAAVTGQQLSRMDRVP